MKRADRGIAIIEQIGALLGALPARIGNVVPVYAVELRDADLLTPRLVRTLRERGARLCIALHPRMPVAARQSAALRAMDALEDEGDDWRTERAAGRALDPGGRNAIRRSARALRTI